MRLTNLELGLWLLYYCLRLTSLMLEEQVQRMGTVYNHEEVYYPVALSCPALETLRTNQVAGRREPPALCHKRRFHRNSPGTPGWLSYPAACDTWEQFFKCGFGDQSWGHAHAKYTMLYHWATPSPYPGASEMRWTTLWVAPKPSCSLQRVNKTNWF